MYCTALHFYCQQSSFAVEGVWVLAVFNVDGLDVAFRPGGRIERQDVTIGGHDYEDRRLHGEWNSPADADDPDKKCRIESIRSFNDHGQQTCPRPLASAICINSRAAATTSLSISLVFTGSTASS